MKRILALLMVLVLSFGVVACGNNNAPANNGGYDTGATETTETVETETTDDGEEITLTWLHHFEEEGMNNWVNDMAAKYHEQNPNVTIDIQSTGFDNYMTLLKTKIAGNDAPDIFDLPTIGANLDFIENDYLVDLSDSVVADRLVDSAIDGGSYDGSLYLIPYEQSGFGVYYNEDLFAEAGIEGTPETYTEFVDALEKLEAAGITPIGHAYGDLWTLICDFFADSLVSQAGSVDGWHDQIVTRDIRFSDNAGGIKDSFERMKERYAYGNADPFATDWNTVTNQFANGEVAIIINGTWTIDACKTINPDLNMGTFAFPHSEDPALNQYPLGATSGFVGFKGSNNADEVVKFLEFLTEEENAKALAESRKTLAIVKGIEPEIDETLKEIVVNYINEDKVFSISNVNRDLPGQFQDTFFDYLSEYLLTDASVDEILSEMDDEFDSLAEHAE
jgi:ABC-type glycerol-3-phosphate transport system substrate-binding protein